MAVLDTVKFIAPGLTATMTDDEINTAISLASERMSVCVWGNKYSQGLAYLAAHIIAIVARGQAGAGGAVGPVTQEMAGRVQISYAVPQGWDENPLKSTPFGNEFLNLRSKLARTRMFNTGFDNLCPEEIDGYDGPY